MTKMKTNIYNGLTYERRSDFLVLVYLVHTR